MTGFVADRHLRSLAALSVVGLVAAAIVFAATRAQGREGTEAEANDGGAWLLKRDAGAIGHLNRTVLEVTAGVRVADPGADLDIDQSTGSIVVHDADRSTVAVLDPRTHQLQGELSVPSTVRVRARPGGLVVWQTNPLTVWNLLIEEAVAAADLSEIEPDFAADSDGILTLGPDGPVAYVTAEDQLVRLGRARAGSSRQHSTTFLGLEAAPDSITTLGSLIVVTAGDRVVLVDEQDVETLDLTGGPFTLQAPGPAAADLALIDAAGRLHHLDVSSGVLHPGPLLAGTDPLPPISHGGCVFTVVTGPPVFERHCGGGPAGTSRTDPDRTDADHTDPDRTAERIPLAGAGAELRLRLVNGWVWVNDLESGGAWVADGRTDLARIDDWGAALAKDRTDESEAVTEDGGGLEQTLLVPDSDEARIASADQIDEDGVNQPPIARDDSAETRVDRPVVVAVLANDEDADGDILGVDEVELAGASSEAQVWVTTSGRAIQITPAAGFTGTLRARYVISDGRGGTAEATATVTVHSGSPDTNRPPETATDIATVRAGSSVSLNVLTNDSDPDGDSLVLRSVTGDGGSIVFDPSGQVILTPHGGDGADTDQDVAALRAGRELTYVVSDDHGAEAEGRIRLVVRMADANGAPDARNDSAVTAVGRHARLNVLDNDTDPDGDALIVTRQPAQLAGPSMNPADLHLSSDGEFTLLPPSAGVYLFEYVVSDGQITDAARVRIDVAGADADRPPTAVRDDVTIARGATRLVRVLDNDGDPDGDVVGMVDWTPVPGLGIEEVPGLGFRVTPAADAPDRISFRYAISDGNSDPVSTAVVVAVVDVGTINQPPVPRTDLVEVRAGRTTSIPVLRNDHDPEGGSLAVTRVEGVDLGSSSPDDGVPGSGAGGRDQVVVGVDATGQAVTVTVGPDVVRSFRLTYEVTDEQGSRAASTVEVRIVAAGRPNRPPVARPDIVRVVSVDEARGEGSPIPVLANDSDPDGDPLALEGILTQPANGEVESLGDGTVGYRPSPGFTGTDRFSYVVVDTEGGRAVGQVLVGVAPRISANRPPSANDDVIAVAAPTDPRRAAASTVFLDVLANDHDPDHDPLTIVSVDGPVRGALHLDDDGRLRFVPPVLAAVGSGPVGEAASTELSFVYTVTDGHGHTDDALVRLRLEPHPPKVPPVAVDDRVGPERPGRRIAVEVLANDHDPDGARARLRLTSDDPAVTVVGSTLQLVVGRASSQHRYSITDADGLRSTATLTVFVADNQAPIVANHRTRTAHDTPMTLSLGRQATDPDGDPLFFVCCDQTRGGVAETVRSAPGTLEVRFTPSPGFVGEAAFTYTVDDRQGHVAAGFVGITVEAPANRPPVVRTDPITMEAGTRIPVSLDAVATDPDTGDVLRLEVVTTTRGIEAAVVGDVLQVALGPDAAGRREQVTIRATDPAGATGTGTIVVTGRPTTAARPRAIADTATTQQGTPVTVAVLANDVDPLGRGLRLVGIGSTEAGFATVDGQRLRFEPRSSFFGTATVTYTARDATDAPDRETVGQLVIDVIGRPAAPNPPAGSAGDASATLTWATPTDNGAPIDAYRLEATSSAPDVEPTVIDLGVRNGHTIRGLVNGTDYRFRLTARNAAGWGEVGPWSATLRPDTRPGAPDPPQVAFGDGELAVSWQPPANQGSTVSGYRLEIGGGTNQALALGLTTSHPWRNLANGVEYQFRVAAVNAAGVSEWSRWSAGTHPLGAPFAPAAPMVTRGDRALELTWVPPDGNGDQPSAYEIEMRSTGRRVLVPGGTTTGHRWADLANGSAQAFRVRAVNRAPTAGAWSAWSAPVIPCSIPDAPAAPSVVRGDGLLTVSWTEPGDQGCAVVGYDIRATGDGRTIAATAGAGAGAATITGATNGVAYTVEIRAANEEGVGPWSPQSVPVTPAGSPTAPVIGTATATAVGQIALTWSAAAGNGSTVDRHDLSVDGGPASAVGSTTHTAIGLATNTTYSFRVRGCNAVACGPWSGSVSALTWGPPTAPRSVGATAGNATWQLSWSTPAGDGGSAVAAYEHRVNGGAVTVVGPQTFAHQMNGAVNGTAYTGEVRACNQVGCGPWAAASATPAAPPPLVRISIGSLYTGSGCVGTCHRVQLDAANLTPFSTATVQCHDSRVGLFKTGTAIVAADGTLATTPCFYGYPGDTVWVSVNGTESNRILWP